MDRKAAGVLLVCLGLLSVVAVGGATAASQSTAVDAADAQVLDSVLEDTETGEVEIAPGLRDANGEVEVIVSLVESDRASSTAGLQAHASATQQPLVEFAQARSGVTVENQFWLTNAALVTVDTSAVSLSDLASIEGVRALHENVRFETTTTAVPETGLADSDVSATNGSYTYGLEQINAPTAWENHNTTGEGASVAVLDTGVDADHPDLSVTKWQEFDGDGNPVDSEPNDGDGHGTHVSGTATGAQNPAGDVPAFGVAPDADLYGVKVLADDGGGSFAQIIAGMEWAVNESADIISMSLGATGFYDQMIAPVQNAHAAGTVVITSAGNSGEGSTGSPGNVYESIAVGASNSNQGIASFSSGEVVDTAADWSNPPAAWPSQYTVPTIAAPGVNTLSSVPGGGYDDTYSGTSMAAPHVSGAVALAESATNGSLAPAFIEEALEQTAFKPGDAPAPPGERDTRYGSGIIDADALISYLQGIEDEPLLTLTASGPDSIEAGETLDINYTIENIGGAEGNESAVTLLVNGTDEDSVTDITLAPNESTSGTLSFGDTAQYDGELINWTVELQDAGKTASGQTGVGADPGTNITIQSLDYPDSIAPTDSLSVDYTLENTGLEDGTESFVDLKVNGTDSTFDDTDTDVTVPGGGTASGTLTFDNVSGHFDAGDTIEFTVELWDFGDVAEGSATVEVPDGPSLHLESATAPETVETNGTLTVNYTLANNGGAEGTESAVDLLINGTVEDTDTNVTVPAGGNTSGSLYFDGVDEYNEGEFIDWTVETANATGTESGSTAVGQVPEANIVIQSLDYNETVPVGEGLSVDYTLENTGLEDGTESFVDLLIDGTDNAFDDTDSDVAVPAGGTTSGTLSFDAIGDYYQPGDTINFSVELWDFGDVAEGQATYEVPDEPVLQLASVDAPSVLTAGEDLAINYTIENIGSVAGTESSVELLVNGTVEDEDTNVTVPGQGTTTGTLVYENVDGLSAPKSIGVQAGVEPVESTDSVEIDRALRDARGEVEAIVSLPESERASSPAALQAHASATQDPLVKFAADRPGVTVEQRFWLTNAALVTVDTTSVSLSELAAVEGVRALHENVRFEVTSATTGPALVGSGVEATNTSYTYGLEQINAPTAWENYDTKGGGASVAVLDTGVAADHPDLSVAKWQEFDGDGNPIDSEPNDGQGHGTHVSGTVSGPVDTAGDVPAYGVAPNVSLYGVKVLDDSGGGSFAQIIAGMQWAVNESVDIISMSLGAGGFNDQMIAPVQNAHDAGTVVVASAGNSGEGSSGSPGNVYDSIAVGASNPSEGIAGFSSGEVVDTANDWSDPPAAWPDQYTVPTIAAPGVDTLSSVPGGGYDDTYSGTSMAAPHVSGAVALAESALDEELSPSEIEEALEATAFKPGDAPAPPGERDTRYGSGIINADAFIAFLDGVSGSVPWTISLADTGDSTSGEVFIEEPDVAGDFQITGVETNAPLPEGETLEVTVTIENIGSEAGAQNVTAHSQVLGTNTTLVELAPGETATHTMTMELGTGPEYVGNHTLTVESETHGVEEPVEVHLPAVPGGDDPPKDMDDDGTFEDVDGDGTLSAIDVQMLFDNFDETAMNEHGWAYDYDGDGTVTIFDVQALFNELQTAN